MSAVNRPIIFPGGIALLASLFFFLPVPGGNCSAEDAGADSAGQRPAVAAEFKPYTMDSTYFSCGIPSIWSLEREKDQDEDYKIYEIGLDAGTDHARINVSYYAADNDDFNGYADFIGSNSKNSLGETKNDRERYEPVKDTILDKRKAFILANTRMVYLFPESKSDASIQLSEKMYVLPAKKGFYVIRLSALTATFSKYLPVFERVACTFKGRP